MDGRLRELERSAASGDHEARLRLVKALKRSGALGGKRWPDSLAWLTRDWVEEHCFWPELADMGPEGFDSALLSWACRLEEVVETHLGERSSVTERRVHGSVVVIARLKSTIVVPLRQEGVVVGNRELTRVQERTVAIVQARHVYDLSVGTICSPFPGTLRADSKLGNLFRVDGGAGAIDALRADLDRARDDMERDRRLAWPHAEAYAP